MALEAATTINQLVVDNPTGLDVRAQGDDHIRLIKKTLKNTFPGVTGPVTVSHEQLNSIGVPGNINFPGMIVMWSGSVTAIPAGWKLCNGSGTLSNGSPIPDLRGRFIVGTATNSGASYNVGQTGGSANITYNGATANHALTEAQLPPHDHKVYGLNISAEPKTGGLGMAKPSSTMGATLMGGTGLAGSGQGHSHSLSVNMVGANLPPYYALAFIIKE